MAKMKSGNVKLVEFEMRKILLIFPVILMNLMWFKCVNYDSKSLDMYHFVFEEHIHKETNKIKLSLHNILIK